MNQQEVLKVANDQCADALGYNFSSRYINPQVQLFVTTKMIVFLIKLGMYFIFFSKFSQMMVARGHHPKVYLLRKS